MAVNAQIKGQCQTFEIERRRALHTPGYYSAEDWESTILVWRHEFEVTSSK